MQLFEFVPRLVYAKAPKASSKAISSQVPVLTIHFIRVPVFQAQAFFRHGHHVMQVYRTGVFHSIPFGEDSADAPAKKKAIDLLLKHEK